MSRAFFASASTTASLLCLLLAAVAIGMPSGAAGEAIADDYGQYTLMSASERSPDVHALGGLNTQPTMSRDGDVVAWTNLPVEQEGAVPTLYWSLRDAEGNPSVAQKIPISAEEGRHISQPQVETFGGDLNSFGLAFISDAAFGQANPAPGTDQVFWVLITYDGSGPHQPEPITHFLPGSEQIAIDGFASAGKQGKSIVFSRKTDLFGEQECFYGVVSGTPLTMFTNTSSSANRACLFPNLSPDGTQLVFVSNYDFHALETPTPSNHYHVWTVAAGDVNGNSNYMNFRRVTPDYSSTFDDDITVDMQAAAVSDDGSVVAFISNVDIKGAKVQDRDGEAFQTVQYAKKNKDGQYEFFTIERDDDSFDLKQDPKMTKVNSDGTRIWYNMVSGEASKNDLLEYILDNEESTYLACEAPVIGEATFDVRDDGSVAVFGSTRNFFEINEVEIESDEAGNPVNEIWLYDNTIVEGATCPGEAITWKTHATGIAMAVLGSVLASFCIVVVMFYKKNSVLK